MKSVLPLKAGPSVGWVCWLCRKMKAATKKLALN